VTFVAEDAQFTPKAVETDDEREKLMFRVKLTIDAELLNLWQSRVKTGVRGVGYVRVKRDAAWPDDLAVKLPTATKDNATD
jgi:HlyD family secretion protein